MASPASPGTAGSCRSRSPTTNGDGYYSWIIDGIIWAADQGADVINLSLGGDVDDPFLEDACKYAHDKGAVVVAAAGNDGVGVVLYPAAYDDYVLAVAASDYNDAIADFSSFGPQVDVAAPGVWILGTAPQWYVGDGYLPYLFASGTSAGRAPRLRDGGPHQEPQARPSGRRHHEGHPVHRRRHQRGRSIPAATTTSATAGSTWTGPSSRTSSSSAPDDMIKFLRVRNLATIEDLEVHLDAGFSILTGRDGRRQVHHHRRHPPHPGRKGLARARPDGQGRGLRRGRLRRLAAAPRPGRPARARGRRAPHPALGHRPGHGQGLRQRRPRPGPPAPRARPRGSSTSTARTTTSSSSISRTTSPTSTTTLDDPGLVRETARAAQELRRLLQEKRDLEAREKEREQRLDFIAYQLKEIEAAALRPGEDEEPPPRTGDPPERREDRRPRRQGPRPGLPRRGLARRPPRPAQVRPRGPRRLRSRPSANSGEGIEDASILLQDASDSLVRFKDRRAVAPENPEEIEERLSVIEKLKRKYGGTIEAVVAHGDGLRRERAGLESGRERLRELEAVIGDEIRRVRARRRPPRRRAGQGGGPARPDHRKGDRPARHDEGPVQGPARGDGAVPRRPRDHPRPGRRGRRVPPLAQPGRGAEALAAHRLGRRAVADDAGPQVGRQGQREPQDPHLRRDRFRHRGQDGRVHRPQARPARGPPPGHLHHPPAPDRLGRGPPLQRRQARRKGADLHGRAQARPGRADRGDRPAHRREPPDRGVPGDRPGDARRQTARKVRKNEQTRLRPVPLPPGIQLFPGGRRGLRRGLRPRQGDRPARSRSPSAAASPGGPTGAAP